jgi:hypothetical protein
VGTPPSGKEDDEASDLSKSIRAVARVRLAFLLVLVAGCGSGGGDKTFEGDGYSFTYPGSWEEFENAPSAAATGTVVSSKSFAPERGGSGFVITVYRLSSSVTADNIDSIAPEVAAVTEQIFRQAGGQMTARPTKVTVAGHPGFSAKGTAVTPQGTRVQSRVTLVFDGTTEYFLTCQFTPDAAEEMLKGCNKVLESFELR